MRKTRRLTRRSFIATVAGGAAAGAMLVVSQEAAAQSGCSDSDPGDPLGNGRRCTGGTSTRTGCSDRDSGGGRDPGGQGRRCVATGCSDSDPSDPGGSGRNCGGNQRAGSDIRGRCTHAECTCTSYVQPDEGWSCARQGCGHHYNWHENPDA